MFLTSKPAASTCVMTQPREQDASAPGNSRANLLDVNKLEWVMSHSENGRVKQQTHFAFLHAEHTRMSSCQSILFTLVVPQFWSLSVSFLASPNVWRRNAKTLRATLKIPHLTPIPPKYQDRPSRLRRPERRARTVSHASSRILPYICGLRGRKGVLQLGASERERVQAPDVELLEDLRGV